MVLCALSIFGIVVLIATELVRRSNLAWNASASILLQGLHRSLHRPAFLLGSG